MKEDNKTTMFELLNKRMTEEEIIKVTTEYDNKFNKLESNWNELKKWLEEESTKTIYNVGHLTSICATLNKMQELENKYENNDCK